MRRAPGFWLSLLILLLLAVLPGASQSIAKKRLLSLTQAALYKHTSLGPAEKAVVELGQEGGFDVTALAGYKQDRDKLDFSFLSASYLAQFDGIMMMTNGNLPMDESQKRALIEFVPDGKGFVGVHCASLTFYNYPEFGEMLGGYFRRAVKQKKIAVLKVEDQNHPATRMLGPSWPLADEFYQFGTAAWDAARPGENTDALFGNHIPMGFSRDRVHVILSIDTAHTDLSDLPDLKPQGDYPQAWYRTFGKGRSFYTSLGHRDDIWSSDPVFRAHIRGAIRWALGLEN